MPWKTKADVGKHHKHCSKQRGCVRVWVRVANETLRRTKSDATAVRVANKAAYRWLQKHGKIKKKRYESLDDVVLETLEGLTVAQAIEKLLTLDPWCNSSTDVFEASRSGCNSQGVLSDEC